ncbi:Isoquinoline 1-oxidoreductase subunit [Croceicoccus sp. Ery5]|uniref:Isoquinoline 1-oxidoreductase subunit n=1 Tax=Croceicoccus sp. Ery5 TaxID=1703340 RepID=UPI001E61E0FE|nr:Isoquinoline 1-oxidoreductase subunit [Croceicoccus sp. Ery5]
MIVAGRILLAASVAVVGIAATGTDSSGDTAVRSLRDPASFASIDSEQARSQAIFSEMAKVFQHPRCLNCHPRTDTPTQGDVMIVHSPPVARGPDNHGMPAMECSTCHGDSNMPLPTGEGSIPGDPHWSLAPREMAWAGRSVRQICEQVKDPARNGGKTLDEIVTHNREDHLVGWAWHPGADRTPAPGSQDLFGRLTAAWVASGAHCPD